VAGGEIPRRAARSVERPWATPRRPQTAHSRQRRRLVAAQRPWGGLWGGGGQAEAWLQQARALAGAVDSCMVGSTVPHAAAGRRCCSQVFDRLSSPSPSHTYTFAPSCIMPAPRNCHLAESALASRAMRPDEANALQDMPTVWQPATMTRPNGRIGRRTLRLNPRPQTPNPCDPALQEDFGWRLDRAGAEGEVLRLEGATSSAERARLIKAFNHPNGRAKARLFASVPLPRPARRASRAARRAPRGPPARSCRP
jgi:hypothetical protein